MTSSAARWFRPVAIVALALALVLPLAACGKKGKGEGTTAAAGNGAKPAAGGALDGDVLALLTPPGPLTDDLIQRLSALRIKQLWLLAGTFSADGEKWRPAPPPTLKYRLPLGCFVVVRPSWQKSMAGGGAAAGEEVAGRLGEAAAALRTKGNEVRAAHVVFVDGDLSPADLKAFVEGLRKGLAGKIDGSVSLSLPSEFYRQEGAPASLEKVDFIVPLLLGTPASVVGEAVARYPNPAAPTAVEAAGKPYLAGFWLAGGGLVLDDSGVVQKELPESALDRFTEIPQTKITLGGAFEMESGYTYRLFPPKATTVLGVAVPAGAEARFRGVTPSGSSRRWVTSRAATGRGIGAGSTSPPTSRRTTARSAWNR